MKIFSWFVATIHGPWSCIEVHFSALEQHASESDIALLQVPRLRVPIGLQRPAYAQESPKHWQHCYRWQWEWDQVTQEHHQQQFIGHFQVRKSGQFLVQFICSKLLMSVVRVLVKVPRTVYTLTRYWVTITSGMVEWFDQGLQDCHLLASPRQNKNWECIF